jgi:hypothetical protein
VVGDVAQAQSVAPQKECDRGDVAEVSDGESEHGGERREPRPAGRGGGQSEGDHGANDGQHDREVAFGQPGQKAPSGSQDRAGADRDGDGFRHLVVVS